MKKLVSLFISILVSLFVLVIPTFASPTQLLATPYGAPFHLAGNNIESDAYTGILPANILNGQTQLSVTYNLHGLCIRSGLDGAIIFDQGGWKWAQLANYGTNCLNGAQTVTIPLSDFGVNPSQNLDINGSFHARIWNGTAYVVDISSAILQSSTPTPTSSPTPSPTSTATPSPTSTPTPSPSPSASPDWAIQSIDVMKYTKDVECNQPIQAFIDTEVQRVADSGANYIAISTPYDNPTCSGVVVDSSIFAKKWIDSARAKGLHIWHRHMALAFEGIYGVTKVYNSDPIKIATDYILAHPDQFKTGDIFTPTPEPDSAGINGVSYCSTTCQFENKSDFNQWLRESMNASNLAFKAVGITGVKIGYFGTSGFIVYGANNPDWYGKSFLEPSTVAQMGNTIAMDDYTETFGKDLSYSMTGFKLVWPNARLVMSEWGTITATSSAQQVTQIDNSMAAAKQPFVDGFNYWNLGPAGAESLINSDLSVNSGYTEVQSFYKGLK